MKLKRAAREDRGELFYWRDRTKEADFLLHKAGRFEVLDAKWNEQPDSRDAAVLDKVMAELPARSVKRAALICRTRNAYPLRDGIRAIPVEGI